MRKRLCVIYPFIKLQYLIKFLMFHDLSEFVLTFVTPISQMFV